ncbi:hypothetical protein, partial [Acinetobacter baumannii]|uniref:hypothetical protein n=1 Tax=Acinetobacter baumannii TaxID=470 RepID=UPI002447B7B2
MDIAKTINAQEERKMFLGSLLKVAVEDMKKPKRKTANQQVKEAKEKLLQQILAELRSHKRNIPDEWERGFNSAMSVVANF